MLPQATAASKKKSISADNDTQETFRLDPKNADIDRKMAEYENTDLNQTEQRRKKIEAFKLKKRKKISVDRQIMAKHMYEKGKTLGSGTYGSVFEAENILTSKKFAVKKIYTDNMDEGVPSTALREISICLDLDHKNVVKVEDILYEQNRLFIIFEICFSDLKKIMALTNHPLQPPLLKAFVFQILSAVDHCHSHRIYHRDLKPANILVNRNGVLKIADFGLSRAFSLPFEHNTHEVITLWYRAPEILLGVKIYDSSVDIWSTGVIFGELVRGKPIFPGDSEIDTLFKIFQFLGTPNEKHWPAADNLPHFKTMFPRWAPKDPLAALGRRRKKDGATKNAVAFCMDLLRYNPFERHTAKAALQHPYLKGFSLSPLNAKLVEKCFKVQFDLSA